MKLTVSGSDTGIPLTYGFRIGFDRDDLQKYQHRWQTPVKLVGHGESLMAITVVGTTPRQSTATDEGLGKPMRFPEAERVSSFHLRSTWRHPSVLGHDGRCCRDLFSRKCDTNDFFTFFFHPRCDHWRLHRRRRTGVYSGGRGILHVREKVALYWEDPSGISGWTASGASRASPGEHNVSPACPEDCSVSCARPDKHCDVSGAHIKWGRRYGTAMTDPPE